MSDPSRDPLGSLDQSVAIRIDVICDAFEKEWVAGKRPRIEDHSRDLDGPVHSVLFEELLGLEIEYRRKRDEEPAVDEYTQRFPEHAEQVVQFFKEFDDPLSLRSQRIRGQNRDLSTESAKSSAVRIECPHCRNPVAVVDEPDTNDIVCTTCGSSFQLDRDKTASWAPGGLPHLEEFELLEAVGRGAFGTVYRARDTELDRIVAVKVPRSGSFSTNEDEDRFVREARSAAQLKHPAIVPVYGVGHSDQFPYIVTEFVDGVSLADALSAGRLTFQESALLVADIADALQHAHQQGVVHRDIKPSNIMLERLDVAELETSTGLGSSAGSTLNSSDSGSGSSVRSGSRTSSKGIQRRFQPRLMDFGLALRDEGEVTVTMEGQVLGTPAYMSPEQASGASHTVDGRSDIYSLGAILYELLTGDLPFRGNARMLIHQVQYDEPRAPRRLNDQIPRDLETICLKCLDKNPEKRYQTAAAFASDLYRYLRGEPILSRPISRMARGWRWCKRNRMVATLTTLVAMSMAIGSAVSLYFAIEANHRTVFAIEQQELAIEQQELAIEQQELANRSRDASKFEALRANIHQSLASNKANDLDRQLYANKIALTDRELERGNVARALQLLDECRSSMRGWEWYRLKRLTSVQETELEGHAAGVLQIDWNPGGDLVATTSLDGTARVWNPDTGEMVKTFRLGTKTVYGIDWSPDGKTLALSGGELYTDQGE